MPTLPSPAHCVFCIESHATIPDADPETVFRGLSNLTAYDWNAFTPAFRISPASAIQLDATRRPPQLILSVGTRIHISIGGFGPIKQRERITRWDVQGMCIGWAQDVVPSWMGWMLATERVQCVRITQGIGGEAMTEYYQYIVSMAGSSSETQTA